MLPSRRVALSCATLLSAAVTAGALVPTAASAATRTAPADPHRLQRVLGDSHPGFLGGTSRRTATRRLTLDASPSSPSGASLAAAATTCVSTFGNSAADRVLVTWLDPQGTTLAVSKFVIQRGNGFQWRTIATVGASARSYLDRTVPMDGEWTRYQARAVFSDGTMSASDCGYGGGFDGSDVLAVAGGTDPAVPPTTLVQNQGDPSWLDSVPLGTGGAVFDASYSPDGRRVVYAGAPDTSSPLQLLVRPANGTGAATPLSTQAAATNLVEPAWSPDGRRVIATGYVSDTSSELVSVDVATGAATAVPGGSNLSQPRWLNGTDVVATDLTSGTAPLVRLRTTTGARTTIPGTAGGADPALSPNGTQLLFTTWSGLDTEPTVLHRIAVGGGTPSTVASGTQNGDLWSPTWSADGSRVLWVDQYQSLMSAAPDGTDSRYLKGPSETGAQVIQSLATRRTYTAGTSDFTGDGHNDVLARDGYGVLWLYPSTGMTFGTRRKVGTGWNVFTSVLAAGDLTGDGKADVLARDRDGTLWLYPGNGAVTSSYSWGPRIKAGTGWNAMTALLSPGDWDGDGLADLLARNRYGDLMLYPGNGLGGLRAGRRIGTGWNVMTSLVGAGDLGMDGRGDLVARDGSGVLWLYPANGTGGFLARRRLGTGWSGMTALVGIETTSSSGDSLLARDSSGRLWLYYTLDGQKLEGNRYQSGSGWQVFNVITG